jgi:hypothetical protein
MAVRKKAAVRQKKATPATGASRDERGRLGEVFMALLAGDFEAHGRSTIEALRTEKPQEYLKVVASLLPKEGSAAGGETIVAEIRRVIVRPQH